MTTHSTWLGRVLRAMDAATVDSTAPSSLTGFAGVGNVSVTHLCNVLSQELGIRTGGWFRTLRLCVAAYRLAREPHASVGEVAAAAGYDSHSSFSRAFKDAFEVSPRQVRQGTAPAGEYLVNTLGPLHEERYEALKVAAVSHYGPLGASRQAWTRLRERLHSLGQLNDRMTLVGITYDDPVMSLGGAHIRYDACAVVEQIRPEIRGLEWQILPPVIGYFLRPQPRIATHSPVTFILTTLKLWNTNGGELSTDRWQPPYRDYYANWTDALTSQSSPVRSRVVVEAPACNPSGGQ